MTSYDTGYNRDLARSQRLYDYANIKNDRIQYNATPLHGGSKYGCGNDPDRDMGRTFSNAATANGRGYSGGRRGAELADIASPSGQFSVPARPRGAGMKKGSAEAKAHMAKLRARKGKGMSGGTGNVYGMPELLGRTTQALEGSGGTDGFPSGFKDNNPNAMSGGAVPLKNQLVGILDDRTTGRGMSGGDFWSDFGDGFVKGFTGTLNVASKILPFIGLGEDGAEGCGMSGGNANISSELALMSGSTPLAEAFLGGRMVNSVPKDEKVMLLKKALADYTMMRQLHKHLKAAQGRGKLTITHGKGMSGGGIMEPEVSGEVGHPRYSYGKLADTAGDSNVGSGGGRKLTGGRKLKLPQEMYGSTMLKGGQLSHDANMAMADAMGDIFAGMGQSGGMDRCVGGKKARLVKGSPEAKAYMASIRKKKGRGESGGGMSGGDDIGGFFDGLSQTFSDLGKSGPAPPLGIGGKKMKGGDFFDDLGKMASAAAPFIEYLI